MKSILAAVGGFLACTTALADDVSGSERMLCSSSQATICFETGECFRAQPWELDVPQFVLVDLENRTISTTGSGEERRSSPVRSVSREEGVVFLQGIEQRRAFSIVIEEALGVFNAAIARDGVTVSVFGACTDAARVQGQ